MPIFGLTFFGDNSIISGPISIKFCMKYQEYIIHWLLMRNLTILIFVGNWACSPRGTKGSEASKPGQKVWSRGPTFGRSHRLLFQNRVFVNVEACNKCSYKRLTEREDDGGSEFTVIDLHRCPSGDAPALSGLFRGVSWSSPVAGLSGVVRRDRVPALVRAEEVVVGSSCGLWRVVGVIMGLRTWSTWFTMVRSTTVKRQVTG